MTTGLSPSTFIDRIRIDHARSLMARKALKSGAVAEACGFGSQSAFFRCYKRVRGCAPRADEVLVLSG
jgi:transcriptional regulator GlxA family with amidase domain